MIAKIQQKKYLAAFTLVEILIALVIFAIMSIITSSVIYTVFQARDRVNLQADRLAQLQFALIIMQRDFEQIVMRPITAENFSTIAAFNGNEHGLEFTRAGYMNPNAQEQRSTLQRVAYQIEGDKLWRINWLGLDRSPGIVNTRRMLIDKISNVRFGYLDQTNKVIPIWTTLSTPLLPKAVQTRFTVNGWGDVSLLFAIPAGIQVKKEKH